MSTMLLQLNEWSEKRLLIALPLGNPETLIFVAAMLAGMFAARTLPLPWGHKLEPINQQGRS